MGQSFGIPGRTKDSKDFVLNLFETFVSNDGRICEREVPLLRKALKGHSRQVEKQYDAVLMSARILKVGETSNTRVLVKDYEEVYNEPLPWPDMEERHRDCNHDDAA